MPFSPEFAEMLSSMLDMDVKEYQSKPMDASQNINLRARLWLDGAAGLTRLAKSDEEKLIAFQWRSYGSIMEVLAGLVGYQEAT